jgi:large subunit ribosomal protein L4
MRRGALRSALSERLREGNVIVLDEFTLGAAKTKDFISALGTLGLEGKTLIVDSHDNDNLLLASRNVKRAKITTSRSLNIYDLLYHEKLVLSRTAAEELGDMLDPKRRTGAHDDDAEEGGTTTDAAAENTTEEAA